MEPRRAAIIDATSSGTATTTITRAVPRAEPFIAGGPRSTSGSTIVSTPAATVTAASSHDSG